MNANTTRLKRVFAQLMRIDRLRNTYCRLRYLLLKRRMKIVPDVAERVGEHTIRHNMGALRERAAFGMGNRMGLLLYPLAAVLRNRPDARVLIVGPRTEDDLYWARALGMANVRGLDLFSYSPMIDIGDIHETPYEDEAFDAVILGWVISYSTRPEWLVRECRRITKKGGYLGFGIESNPEHRRTGKYGPPRANWLNCGRDIEQIVREPIVFVHDPMLDVPTDNAIIFQMTELG